MAPCGPLYSLRTTPPDQRRSNHRRQNHELACLSLSDGCAWHVQLNYSAPGV